MKNIDESVLPTCPQCLWELENNRYFWFKTPYPPEHDDLVELKSYHNPSKGSKSIKGSYCARHSILSNCSGRSE